MKMPKPKDLIPYHPVEAEREFMLLVLVESRKKRVKHEVGNASKDLQEFFDVIFKTGYAVVPRGLVDAWAWYILKQRRRERRRQQRRRHAER